MQSNGEETGAKKIVFMSDLPTLISGPPSANKSVCELTEHERVVCLMPKSACTPGTSAEPQLWHLENYFSDFCCVSGRKI